MVDTVEERSDPGSENALSDYYIERNLKCKESYREVCVVFSILLAFVAKMYASNVSLSIYIYVFLGVSALGSFIFFGSVLHSSSMICEEVQESSLQTQSPSHAFLFESAAAVFHVLAIVVCMFDMHDETLSEIGLAVSLSCELLTIWCIFKGFQQPIIEIIDSTESKDKELELNETLESAEA